MFLESNRNDTDRAGWIEIICGSMFSGKTEELIRRLNRARIARQRVEIFKPAMENRYSEEEVVSHNENTIKSTPVQSSGEILFYSHEAEVIGIDEAQFFDMELPSVCNQLANQGARVIVAGLDMDFQGKPFGPIPQLLAVAEYVTKVHAICMKCGNLAQFSYRTVENTQRVMLGETESYSPLCRSCFNKMNRNKK